MLDPVLTLLQKEHPYTAPAARTRYAYLLHEAVHRRPHSTRSYAVKKSAGCIKRPNDPTYAPTQLSKLPRGPP